jgi:thiamine-monophosphate kinase
MREQDFLDLLAGRATLPSRTELGIGDDSALVACPGGNLLITVDAFVEGVHFPSWASPGRVVRRCVTAALSDINAMGGLGRDLFAALGLPRKKSMDLPEYLDGFLSACGRHGLRLMGGDTVSASNPFLSLTVTGMLPPGKKPLTRCGAKPGDLLYVSGPLGRMGLAVRRVGEGWELRKGLPVPPKGQDPGLPDAGDLLEYYFAPDMPQGLGRELLLSGRVTACMDLSDGLSTDLARLCASSGCGAVVEGEAVPCAPEVVRAIAEDRARLSLLLGSGEEFQLLFTSPEKLPWPAIGRMTKEKGLMLRWRGTTVPLSTTGYDHFGDPSQASE